MNEFFVNNFSLKGLVLEYKIYSYVCIYYEEYYIRILLSIVKIKGLQNTSLLQIIYYPFLLASQTVSQKTVGNHSKMQFWRNFHSLKLLKSEKSVRGATKA